MRSLRIWTAAASAVGARGTWCARQSTPCAECSATRSSLITPCEPLRIAVGAANGTLSLYVEHSGDGQNWYTKSGGAALLQVPANIGATTSKSGVETGSERAPFMRSSMASAANLRW